jgi:branched-chain amino acid transport system substrate-binding protein
MRSKKISGALISIIAVVVLGLTAVGASSAGKPAYNLTIGTDESSPFASACCTIPMTNGFQAWISHVNKTGGVNGHKINISVMDDRSDVTTGLSNYQRALSSNTLGFLLGGSSTVFTPIASRAIEDHIVESNGGGYQGGIGVYPYVYNILGNLPMFADIVPRFAKTRVLSTENSVAAYLTYDSTLTETFQPRIVGTLQGQGWQVKYNQLVPSSVTDFSVAAGNIAAAKPNIVIVDLLESQLPQFISQLRARDVHAPILNFSSNISDKAKNSIGDPNLFFVEGTAPATDLSNPAIKAMGVYAKQGGYTTGVDNAFFVYGYVHAQVITAALKKCGDKCTRSSFNDALGHTTIPGGGLMAGNPGYSPKSHVMTKRLIVVRWNKAKHKLVNVAGFTLTGK